MDRGTLRRLKPQVQGKAAGAVAFPLGWGWHGSACNAGLSCLVPGDVRVGSGRKKRVLTVHAELVAANFSRDGLSGFWLPVMVRFQGWRCSSVG
jgi:hypothetical protein